jgi:hypothetical protein
MPISVRLPPRVEQRLAEYCARARVTKSEAVKRALEGLFQAEGGTGISAAANRFIGSDSRPGDVARNTKRLLKRDFRGK